MYLKITKEKRYFLKIKTENLARYNNRCSLCGKTEDLEFAHLQATLLSGCGRGSRQRHLDIKRHPDRYTLLCKSCHTEFDNI